MKSLFFGFNPPFLSDIAVMPVQADERLIKNDLLQLLLTSPGERVFRGNFGTAVRSTLFEQIDDISIDSLRSSILEAIDTFEPRVKVSELLIQPEENKNQLSIKLFGSLINTPNKTLEIDLSLPLNNTIPQEQLI